VKQKFGKRGVKEQAQMGRGGASIAKKDLLANRRSENKAAPSVVQQRLVLLSFIHWGDGRSTQMLSAKIEKPQRILNATYRKAIATSPRRNSKTVSNPKAENVVNPPATPVKSMSRECVVKKGQRSLAAHSTPTNKQPTIFTINVPNGKRLPSTWFAAVEEIQNLAALPNPPPNATTAICDQEIGSVIIVFISG